MLRDGKTTISQLSSKFKVSKSVLYKIRNQRKYSEDYQGWLFEETSKYITQEKLDMLIEGIIENTLTPINIKDIQSQLLKFHSIEITTHKIAKILKENLRCSFK